MVRWTRVRLTTKEVGHQEDRKCQLWSCKVRVSLSGQQKDVKVGRLMTVHVCNRPDTYHWKTARWESLSRGHHLSSSNGCEHIKSLITNAVRATLKQQTENKRPIECWSVGESKASKNRVVKTRTQNVLVNWWKSRFWVEVRCLDTFKQPQLC